MDYEKQIENDAEEIINGKGYVVIPNVFTKEEIKEAKDLIDKNMDMLLEEAGKKSAIQGEYDDKKDSANLVQGKIIGWNLVYKGKIFEISDTLSFVFIRIGLIVIKIKNLGI